MLKWDQGIPGLCEIEVCYWELPPCQTSGLARFPGLRFEISERPRHQSRRQRHQSRTLKMKLKHCFTTSQNVFNATKNFLQAAPQVLPDFGKAVRPPTSTPVEFFLIAAHFKATCLILLVLMEKNVLLNLNCLACSDCSTACFYLDRKDIWLWPWQPRLYLHLLRSGWSSLVRPPLTMVKKGSLALWYRPHLS